MVCFAVRVNKNVESDIKRCVHARMFIFLSISFFLSLSLSFSRSVLRVELRTAPCCSCAHTVSVGSGLCAAEAGASVRALGEPRPLSARHRQSAGNTPALILHCCEKVFAPCLITFVVYLDVCRTNISDLQAKYRRKTKCSFKIMILFNEGKTFFLQHQAGLCVCVKIKSCKGKAYRVISDTQRELSSLNGEKTWKRIRILPEAAELPRERMSHIEPLAEPEVHARKTVLQRGEQTPSTQRSGCSWGS